MASPTRSSSSLGSRSIFARIFAVLALVGCVIAVYLLVMAFTEDSDEKATPKNDKKNRSAQVQDETVSAESYTVVAGDTLSGIADRTGVPAPKLERLNPDLDAEILNAGQVIELR